MSAVGYKRFALAKPESAAGPEYFFAHSIRNVNHAVAVQGHDTRFSEIKIGVVARHDRIVANGVLKFTGGFNAARNH
jgi:hypothetical protein